MRFGIQRSVFLTRCLAIGFLAATLTACSLGQERSDVQAQDAAVARWKACVARSHSAQLDQTLRVTSRQIEARCEGHRRDVLASYPHHMQNQVDSILSQHIRGTTSAPAVKARFLDL